MKALRLTWLHSCLLGGRRHDYRGEPALPPSPGMDQHALQVGPSGDERAGSGRAALAVAVVVVLAVLLLCAGVTCSACGTFQEMRICMSGFYSSAGLVPEAFDLLSSGVGRGFTEPQCFLLGPIQVKVK